MIGGIADAPPMSTMSLIVAADGDKDDVAGRSVNTFLLGNPCCPLVSETLCDDTLFEASVSPDIDSHLQHIMGIDENHNRWTYTPWRFSLNNEMEFTPDATESMAPGIDHET